MPQNEFGDAGYSCFGAKHTNDFLIDFVFFCETGNIQS